MLRVTRQIVETLGAGEGNARVTRQFVEVLGNPPGEVYFVNATDAIAASDEAIYNLLTNVSSTDALVLDEIVRRIYEASATDGITLGDQGIGEYVRVASDTLVLTDEAIADLEIIRSAPDTLSLNDEAIVVAIWPRDAEDVLSLQDEATIIRELNRESYEWLSLTDAAVGDRIILVSDTLELSEQATVDWILPAGDTLTLDDEATFIGVYGENASDSLTFDETAIPGHVTLREVSDALSLNETSIGDYCRVAEDTIALTDEAVFIFVRLIADTLVLQDEASYVGVYSREIWENLTLTDEANLEREVDVEASDAISLTEEAWLLFEAIDELSLDDSAAADYCQVAYDTLDMLLDFAFAARDRRAGLDELVLTDTAAFNIVKNVAAYDFIPAFTEHAWPGLHRVTASDALQTSYIEYDPYTYEETIVYVGLQDSAKTSIIYAASKEAEDHLSFAEQAIGIKIRADAIAAGATDNLSLTDEARTCSIGVAADSFALTDAAEVATSKLLADELSLLDGASCNIVRNSLSAGDTLELGETVLWYNQLEDFLYVYHPFVGEGSGNLPDPPPEELEGPIFGITDPFKLVYPVIGPFSDTLVLRAPNLGNRDRLQMNRISRETRGGTLVVYADPIWPKIQTLVLNFSGLSWTEASGLHTFMDAHLGLEIGILDWEHRFWKGILTELDEPIVQDGSGCKYSVGFEFEGELATYDPGL